MKSKPKAFPFNDDREKMKDFCLLSKEEFLASYSYLTEEEYEATLNALDYKDLLEYHGWTVSECRNDNGIIGIEIGQCSPAGEDFSFYVEFDGSIKDLAKKVEEYSYDFDVDEHIEMWVEAKRNGTDRSIPSVRRLVEDAEDIDKMLSCLSDSLAEKANDVEDIEEE